MGHYLLLGVALAAGVHIALLNDRTSERVGEILLLYLLVGYCGGPGIVFSTISLVNGPLVAETLGFPAANPFQQFLGFAYLGMSLIAVLALRYRGTYLIAPAVLWAIFFGGATFVHTSDFSAQGALGHGSLLAIFMSHGLISVLILAALWVASPTARCSLPLVDHPDSALDAPPE